MKFKTNKTQTIGLLLLTAWLGSSLCFVPAYAETSPQGQAVTKESAAGKQQTAEKPQPLTAKQKDIRQLVALQDIEGTGRMVADELVNTLKNVVINVPEPVWDEIQKQISVQRLVDNQVSFYENSLSAEEARALRTFFESPAGAKYLKLEEKRGQQFLQQLQSWSQRTMRVVVLKLQGQGYQLPPQMMQALDPGFGGQPYGGAPGYGGGPGGPLGMGAAGLR